MSNPFFKNNGPILFLDILKILKIKDNAVKLNQKVMDIKDLTNSDDTDITFLHSSKYKEAAKNTKASFCITTESLKEVLPKNCTALVVENVLTSVSKLTSKFYPDSVNDNFDDTAIDIIKTKFKDKVKYGKNVLVGENVYIGSNCSIGHNSIIEKNVSIGNDCSIAADCKIISGNHR